MQDDDNNGFGEGAESPELEQTAQRKVGRPAFLKNKRRLDYAIEQEQMDIIQTLADRWGLSRAELVRRMISEFGARYIDKSA